MWVPGAARRDVPLALVHHANQYLITDGYADRDGMGTILGLNAPVASVTDRRGFLPLLQLHLTYKIPINLHMSGTLIEALAWHYPDSCALLERLAAAGLLEMVGSTFSQNVMPFSSDRCNRYQIEHELWLYRTQLLWDPALVKVFWVPERVWHTAKMAPLLQQDDLPNGGYRYVLLDDRLVYPVGTGYSGSPRERFDQDAGRDLDCFLPWTIAGSDGLVMLPISKRLRYLIPGHTSESIARLEELLTWVAERGHEQTIAVYGDDLERAAGVGGWNARYPERYEELLQWLTANPWVRPVRISDWAARIPTPDPRTIEQGTFYELARRWKAGEDYRGWYDDPNCVQHRRYLQQAEQRLLTAEQRGADTSLLDLGWQHLLRASYETSWHSIDNGNAPGQLAPWAAALTSHARSCRVVALAAEWATVRDRLAHADLVDVDDDGTEELVLKNEWLMAVISPRWGGRITYLFDLTGPEGRLAIGNISDDWNLQEELNRYMEVPRNHPGALADVGHENDLYQPVICPPRRGVAAATLRNHQPESPLAGTEKRFLLRPGARHVCVTYRLPPQLRRLSTEVCFSPDYARILRCGRLGLKRMEGGELRGWRNGAARVWLRIDRCHSLVWDTPHQPECGHGLNLRVTSFERLFHLDIGVGQPRHSVCAGDPQLVFVDSLPDSGGNLGGADGHL
jgi:starch synthase